ncbi:MAG: cell division protein ZapA [Bacteroidota bacterium]|nr:cell division protein ZapA [Bacteroidota bacterium]
MEELIAINVVIADRSYRLKTRQQDEETIRKTAKLINEKIVEFRSTFAGKDMQDYISMVMLWFAVEQSKPNGNVVAESEAGKLVEQMNSLLDKALSSQ